MNLKKQFKNRSVFITGADGFVGSHLTDKMVELGADVKVFVRAISSSGLRNISHLRDDIEVHRGDLKDTHSVREAMKSLEGTEDAIIFHLGAQAHVGESWDRPYDTIKTNLIGTLNLLQSVVDLDLDIYKFDTAGTSEEYGNIKEEMKEKHEYKEPGRVILNERSPLNPKSIYATAKVAADFLTLNYYDAYDIPTVVTRMFNNYGPGQNPRYITGTIISQALERDKVELGNLDPKRDMCYVADGVRGHIHVALKGNPGEEYVYGYGKNISMRDWTNMILKIGEEEGYWKNVEVISKEERYRPGDSDVKELHVGYDKLHELTGWEPQVGWEEGIKRTIEWYADNREKWIDRVDWRQFKS